MTARDAAPDPTRARVRATIRGLLDGAAPNGVAPEDCGRWRDVVRGLYDAYEMDGTSGVRHAFQQLARGDAALRALVNGDPPPAPPKPLTPPLPADAQAIYQHEAPCAGWLDDYITYALEVAPGAPRAFHEMMGLTLAAAAIARRLCLPTPGTTLYPNLYALFIGASTLYTKSTAQQVGARVLLSAELDHLLLNPQPTPQALAEEMSYETLPKKRMGPEAKERWLRRRAQAGQRLLLIDEVSGLFASLRREFNAGLLELLLKLYDSPDRLAVSQTVARGEVEIVDGSLTFFGCSTPDAMARYLGDLSLWGNGFFARCAILTPQEPPKRVMFGADGYTQVPLRTVAAGLRRVYELFPVPAAELVEIEEPDGPKGATPAQEVRRTNTHRPEAVSFGEGVWAAFTAYTFAVRYDLLVSPDSGVGSDMHASYGRFSVMCAKVAMILATLDCEALPVVIERRHWARAQRIVEAWRANLHELLRDHMASEDERVAQRIVERLQKDGPLTARELQQRLHHPAKAIREALEVLGAAGQVATAPAGRATKYQLVEA